MLGICLGLQLLFEGSEEDAPSVEQPVPGLAVLPGDVVRFQCDKTEPRLKVPHMGWNAIRWQRDDPLFAGLEQDAYVYFVHSYYVIPGVPEGGDLDESVASADCDYGGPFCASVRKDNLWATQFHPEKSQRVGLKMLENFTGF
jgi:glutamine amidotransferase